MFEIVITSSCVGDAAMKVHGFAPSAGRCKIHLADSDGKKISSDKKVSGEFVETFVWGVALWPTKPYIWLLVMV